jgi:hypothetical protein
VVFREALESVLRGLGDRTVEARIMTNAGETVLTHFALVQLLGAYGSEGAIVIATPLDEG